MKKKFLYVTTALILVSCNTEKYSLTWKVKKEHPIFFKTLMEPIEDNSRKIRINGSSLDSTEVGKELLKALSGTRELQYFTILEKDEAGDIDFKLLSYLPYSDKDPKDYKISDMFSTFMQGISLHSTLNDYGKSVSSGLALRQRNLVNILCQLPDHPVSIGDSWELDVKFVDDLELYPNADIEEKNNVTLVDIKNVDGNIIAIIEYEISSSVEAEINNPFSQEKQVSHLSMGLEANAEFDISSGSWRKFEGVLSSKRTGFVDNEQKQILKLTRTKELPKDVANILKGKTTDAQQKRLKKLAESIEEKDNSTNKQSENKLSVENKNEVLTTEKKETINDECPVIYAVQIIASKASIPLTSKQFTGISDDIYEVIKVEEEYKFKYRVGKECSIQDARILKQKLEKKGFTGIFITKEAAK